MHVLRRCCAQKTGFWLMSVYLYALYIYDKEKIFMFLLSSHIERGRAASLPWVVL